MKTLFKTFRFIIIAFVATTISFGTVVTATYAKDHKAGGSKAGSHQSSSNKKGDKAGNLTIKIKGIRPLKVEIIRKRIRMLLKFPALPLGPSVQVLTQ